MLGAEPRAVSKRTSGQKSCISGPGDKVWPAEGVISKLKDTQDGSGAPMTYEYYHKVIKGSAPKNAPTYRSEQESTTVTKKDVRRFKCDICGYEVESETNLPDDFVCPICGFDRSHFKEI